jgi:hypothetical protein
MERHADQVGQAVAVQDVQERRRRLGDDAAQPAGRSDRALGADRIETRRQRHVRLGFRAPAGQGRCPRVCGPDASRRSCPGRFRDSRPYRREPS